jgi:hypothetical protein
MVVRQGLRQPEPVSGRGLVVPRPVGTRNPRVPHTDLKGETMRETPKASEKQALFGSDRRRTAADSTFPGLGSRRN